MKNFKISLATLLALGSFGYAGGDISPVTAYETEDEVVSEKAYAEEYVDEPIYVAPAPVIEESIYVEPKHTAPPPATVIKSKPAVVPVVPKVVQKDIVANGFYAGLGITGVRYDSGCDCKKENTEDTSYGVIGRVGYDFNQYIGIEARASKTDSDSEVEHMGIYLKPMIPVTNRTNIYGLIGAAKTKVKGDVPHVDSDSLALGGGIEVDLSTDTPRSGRYARSFDGQGDQEKGLGLFIDYERMIVEDDAPDLDTVSAGVTYDF